MSKKARFHSDLVLLPITLRKEGRKEEKKKGRKRGGREGEKKKKPSQTPYSVLQHSQWTSKRVIIYLSIFFQLTFD